MSDIEFIPLSFKAPRDNAPEFVKHRISFKREEMLAYCQASEDEWINGDVKESKGGKLYVQRDNWKPNSERQERQPATASTHGTAAAATAANAAPFPDDDIPF